MKTIIKAVIIIIVLGSFYILKETNLHVETGIFHADMKVQITNDGPITIILESREKYD